MSNLNSTDVYQMSDLLIGLLDTVHRHTTANDKAQSVINPFDAASIVTQVRGLVDVLNDHGGVSSEPRFVQMRTKVEDMEAYLPGPQDMRPALRAPHSDPAVATRVTALKGWWTNQAADEIEMVAEKAVIYGSNSLEQLGRKLAQLQGREVSSEEAQELGCWVNAVQKLERWTDAVMRGQRPKDDTVTDLHTYSVMTLRLRQAGGWPDSIGT